MAFIREWIMNIVVFILLAMIVDMLLPNSSLKKYTKMVTGLLLIAIILTPLLKVASKDFDQLASSISNTDIVNKNKIDNLIESKKKEIQAVQHEYTLEQVGADMKKEVKEELIKRFGKDIQKIKVESSNQTSASKNPVDKVIVYLEEADNDKSISVIKPIDIMIHSDNSDEKQATKESEDILAMLSKSWDVSEKQIELHIGRGDSNLNE
ncbi:stage III sporulation protein AF [Heyndrickxia sporothermodurans]|nr:stage III sporulation protein AF [Heyndrickxia sporothermodurans]